MSLALPVKQRIEAVFEKCGPAALPHWLSANMLWHSTQAARPL